MNALLTLLYLLLCVGIVIFVPPLVVPFASDYGLFTVFDAARAVLLCTALATIWGVYAYKTEVDGRFLLRLFVGGLLVRMIIGLIIFTFKGQNFFGGDALTYDYFGYAQMLGWGGDKYYQSIANQFVRSGEGSGWGMVYLVAAVYQLVGRNMLATQLMNCVFGAATAVVIYLCAHHVFQNIRVARIAGIAVAFYPSLVLWSAQGLKDGPTVFCLAVAILATLKLGEKLSIKYIVVLLCVLLALIALRFYVFYMIAVAIAGAFIIGMQQISATSFARQFVAIILLGLALTYVGVTRSAGVQLERYGDLKLLQTSRSDQARSAESGFGKDVDVSSTSGALSTIPMGVLYLLFAPFPWQITSLRQSITLPEMVIWWASFPLLVLGLWFTIKYRLRMISPILIFTVMLTLAYSVFQGNVGTAYRQRAQLLVFYFIFVAVGFVLMREKREERKRRELEDRQGLAIQQAATYKARPGRSSV
ncbi:MAG TPA: glycosyltransferase family 39 protein [Pyrinomonadaceae bacterium]|nr:glycosyltransferase family 39 protein [Pyrinomonadaceae bacterium]